MSNSKRNTPATNTDQPKIGKGLIRQLLAEVLAEPAEMLSAVPDEVALDEIRRSFAASRTDVGRKQAIKQAKRLLETGVMNQAEITPGESQREKSTVRGEGDETMAESGGLHSDKELTESHVAGGADQEAENVPQRLGFQFSFRTLRELGRGGQGIVYLVEGDDGFAARRALKIFRSSVYDNNASFRADMERMRRIAQMIHLAPHDDLVDIAWFGEHENNFALLMQYIDGFDLRRLVQPSLKPMIKQAVDETRYKRLNSIVYADHQSQSLALQPGIAVYIIERVLRGLSTLHTRGIAHGDIKPSNIMLNATGFLKIIDIGSAFEISSPPGEYYVTPTYAAPEFHERRELTIRSDLASVGYVLIELLSGRSISDALRDPDETTRTIGKVREKKLLQLKQELPDKLTELVPSGIFGSRYLLNLCRRLIDPDPEKRFMDASDGIVNPSSGTYAFYQDLSRANLATCNFHEAIYWLMDVKRATSLPIEPAAMPR